jgi:heavy metal translocating P-type ATPase
MTPRGKPRRVDEEGVCDHCGLPLPRRWSWWRAPLRQENEIGGPAYCCLGCRLAASVARDRGEEGAASRTLSRLGLATFFTMNVMAFTMALWTADVYTLDPSDSARLAATFEGLLRYIVMLFACPVLFLLGWPLLENAVEGLRRGVFSTDLLLGAGVTAAFVYSAVSVLRGAGPVYFEVGCIVLLMVTLGRWLEATGKRKANGALDRLARLMPETARRVRSGEEEAIPLAELVKGDVLRVLAGERIPTDGWVVSGMAFVDEQVLTGESAPRSRQAGDPILGGTLNIDGELFINVTAAGQEGTLARLVELLRQARLARGSYQRLADRVSAWFVPVVTAIAIATFFTHGLRSGWEQGLLQGLAVVLIACPCALGLATPLAVWTALGRAADSQVVFRSGEALEQLAGIRAIRFDKTGTLTTGAPEVVGLTCESDAERPEIERRAAAMASGSSHVLARAILAYVAPNRGTRSPASTEVHTIAGRGVSGLVEGEGVPGWTLLGSRRLIDERGCLIGPALEAAARYAGIDGRTVAWIAWGGRARGLFALEECLRTSARTAVARCRSLAIDVVVLTGDNAARGAALASELGVDVKAELLPEDKVEALRSARHQFGPVAMVGDGVNDAPALAASDLGVALGCGADLSRESAAVCLLGDELDKLPWAIALSRRTVRTIRGNLAWAFGFNTVGVGCAALGWLSPAFAAFLMAGSSALVVVNSLRLTGPGQPLGSPVVDSPKPVAEVATAPALEAAVS